MHTKTLGFHNFPPYPEAEPRGILLIKITNFTMREKKLVYDKDSDIFQPYLHVTDKQHKCSAGIPKTW